MGLQKVLPGSVLGYDAGYPQAAETLLGALFAGGNLMLSQVSNISGLESHVIQNWVARGYLPPPENKRYSRRQLSRILTINMLRSVLSLERICRLLSYVNGHLDDESDDTVDDTRLYMWLIDCISAPEAQTAAKIRHCLEEYAEPFPGAGQRLGQVLEIMVTAYRAAEQKQRAEELIGALDEA